MSILNTLFLITSIGAFSSLAAVLVIRNRVLRMDMGGTPGVRKRLA